MLDLTSLLSVRECARKLLASGLPRIDVAILNAGILGVYGIDFLLATWRVLTDLVHALTFPDFQLSTVGAIAAPQFSDIPSDAPKDLRDEPPLAEVFLSNTLGHYILAHELMPLLRTPVTSPNGAARIIWIGSGTAVDEIDLNDLQGFRAHNPYENSKRVADLLALSTTLPSTAGLVRSFFTVESQSLVSSDNEIVSAPSQATIRTQDPQLLTCHPGMLATNILVLPFPLGHLWIVALWFARLLGSPWHTLDAYTAAIAPVFLALLSPSELSDLHSPSGREGGGAGKWGSTSIGLFGTNGIQRTFVPGWGLGGSISEGPHWDSVGFGNQELGTKAKYGRRTGRHRKSVKPTKEDLEIFEDEAREAWGQMEELRKEWTKRCELYEALGRGDGQVKS